MHRGIPMPSLSLIVASLALRPSLSSSTSNNSVFVARQDIGHILIWRNAAVNLTTTILANLALPYSLFVSGDGEIFVDNGSLQSEVGRWTGNGTRLSSPMSACSKCSGLFVNVKNNLYCSQYTGHQVVRTSLNNTDSALTIVAGTGYPGSASNMLNSPCGIFVTIDLDLYVADFRATTEFSCFDIGEDECNNGGRQRIGTWTITLFNNQEESCLMLMDICSSWIRIIIVLLDLILVVFVAWRDVLVPLLQHLIIYLIQRHSVSIQMETSLCQILAIVEFKSSSWLIIHVVRRLKL